MESKEILPILTLEQIKGTGRKSINEILKIFTDFKPGSPKDLLDTLKEAHKINKKIKIPDVHEVEKCWNKAKEILETSQKNNIKIISRKNPNYPKYLAKIPDPPALLHVKGNIDSLSQKNMIAVVGTRKPTQHGAESARKLGSVFAKEGTTIAVLAHGLHTVYPAENKKLADEIIEKNGAIVSEYSWGKNSFRSYFVERDRIQSGLSLGVFVVETGIKGGTMHTVKFCREQNRALIVMSPKYFREKPQGNAELISDGSADIIFENDNDLDLIKIELNSVCDDLLMAQEKDEFLEITEDFELIKTKIDIEDSASLMHQEKDKTKLTYYI